jgi:hypothetical protein
MFLSEIMNNCFIIIYTKMTEKLLTHRTFKRANKMYYESAMYNKPFLLVYQIFLSSSILFLNRVSKMVHESKISLVKGL